jgi:hypothetical protein
MVGSSWSSRSVSSIGASSLTEREKGLARSSSNGRGRSGEQVALRGEAGGRPESGPECVGGHSGLCDEERGRRRINGNDGERKEEKKGSDQRTGVFRRKCKVDELACLLIQLSRKCARKGRRGASVVWYAAVN